MNSVIKKIFIITALMLPATGLLAAEARTATAQSILKDFAAAVVRIEALQNVTTKVMGREQKMTKELSVQGTVIDAEGTVVTSYAGLDPYYQAPTREIQSSEGNFKLEFSAEITDLRIRLADGNKVPAKLILKDPELDLAFLAPVTPVKTSQHLGFAAAGRAEVLDPLICVNRSDSVGMYEPLLKLNAVQAVFQKPSRRYVLDLTPGTPAFDNAGKLVGIGIMKGQQAAVQISGSPEASSSAMTMLIPIDEVMAVAKQVRK